MKREDIEKAALNYEDSLIYSSVSEQYDVQRAFLKGAEWRINSVWHDAKEAPQHSGMLIVIKQDGTPIVCGPNNSDWETIVKIFHIVKWAYIEDLTPNTEE